MLGGTGMGKRRYFYEPQKVNISSFSEVFKAIGKMEAKSRKLDDMLLIPKDVAGLRKILKKLKRTESEIKAVLSQFKKATAKVKNKLVYIAADFSIREFEQVFAAYSEAGVSLSERLRGALEIVASQKSQLKDKEGNNAFPNIQEMYTKASERRRKRDAALNQILYEMSLELGGGPTVLFETLRTYPNFRPEHLGKGFNEASIRARLEEHFDHLVTRPQKLII